MLTADFVINNASDFNNYFHSGSKGMVNLRNIGSAAGTNVRKNEKWAKAFALLNDKKNRSHGTKIAPISTRKTSMIILDSLMPPPK